MRYPDVIAGAIASSPTSFGCPGLGLVCLVIAFSCASSSVPFTCSQSEQHAFVASTDDAGSGDAYLCLSVNVHVTMCRLHA